MFFYKVKQLRQFEMHPKLEQLDLKELTTQELLTIEAGGFWTAAGYYIGGMTGFFFNALEEAVVIAKAIL